MRKRFCLALAVAVLVASAAGAGEPISITLKKEAKGDVVKKTRTIRNDITADIKANGQSQKQQNTSYSKFTFTDEILDLDERNREATRLKRTYETFDSAEGGQKIDLGLSGKTVLIEKVKGRFRFTIGGKEVEGEIAEVHDYEFNRAKDRQDAIPLQEKLLPKKAVKVGDTWEIDPKVLVKSLPEITKFDTEKSKVTGKLTKVYEKGKSKYGILEYKVAIAIRSYHLPGPDQDVDTSADSKAEGTILLDINIDGTVPNGTMTTKLQFVIGVTAGGSNVTIRSTVQQEEKSEEVKK